MISDEEGVSRFRILFLYGETLGPRLSVVHSHGMEVCLCGREIKPILYKYTHRVFVYLKTYTPYHKSRTELFVSTEQR